MISCVAVGVALLLLSVVDMWKLELGLAPYTVIAGVSSLALAVVIRKYWVMMPDTNREKKYRKLESQQNSRSCAEKSKKMTDNTDICSLPQYIRVMVSNYQPLQTIFAIAQGECHTRGQIKQDEQFSPTVTVVDTATQQTLDCVLLLYGEEPPEVSCRTLFCYIAVQVSHHDAHGSHLYFPYHMEDKPNRQDKLPLTFCFHRPGTVCVIRLSVYSIADSEGVEYMYHSEDCTCVVQIIDRMQHQWHSSDQHGVVRVKEPPLLMYTGPLASAKYHKLEKHFLQLFLSPDYQQIQQLSKLVIA